MREVKNHLLVMLQSLVSVQHSLQETQTNAFKLSVVFSGMLF